jgi:hypothetical protein
MDAKRQRQLTRTEYLQITGLLLIGKKHREALEDVQRALHELTGEDDDPLSGHCGDAIYSEYSARQLCEKLKLTVEGEMD